MAESRLQEFFKRFYAAIQPAQHLTLYRLDIQASGLCDLEAVWRASNNSPDLTFRAATFVRLAERVVDHRLVGVDRTVVQLLLGMGPHTATGVQTRYLKIAALLKANSWEDIRKKVPREFLMKMFLALEREAGLMQAEATSDLRIPFRRHGDDGTIDERPYRLLDYFLSYRLPEDVRQPRRLVEVRELVATECGVDYWEGTFQHRAGQPTRASVEFFGDGRLEIGRPNRDGSTLRQDMRVIFGKPLRRGQCCRFVLVKSLPNASPTNLFRPGRVDDASVSPVTSIDRFTVQVQFPPTVRPRQVWHFESLPADLRPGIHEEGTHVEPSPTGLTWSADGLRPGLAYGLAWKW